MTSVAWRKSSYSGDNGGNCVEVGTFGLVIAVRDSKDQNGLQLAFSTDTWNTFTHHLKGHGHPVSAAPGMGE